jgi:hypothetical protein
MCEYAHFGPVDLYLNTRVSLSLFPLSLPSLSLFSSLSLSLVLVPLLPPPELV